MNKKKLAIVTTHPIQYNAPIFRLLTERNNILVKVFYTWGESVLKEKFDPGFNKVIEWDIPLLQGYDYSMVKNVSKQPGSHHFRGIINPGLIGDIEKWGADAVLVFGWSFQSHFSCLRHFHGKIPVIFRGDSNLLDQGKNFFKDKIRQLFLSFVYKHADFFLFVGKANRDYFVHAGVDASKLFFVPHAIDNKRFASKTNYTIRKSLSLKDDTILFMYAGKFEEKKNVGMLIEAFAKIESSNAHLLLTGNGPEENSLKLKVHQLGELSRNRIHFLDFQNQSMMPDLYQSCDVFVLPSKGPGETWGLSINEAMASSRAVLVSNKCGASLDLVKEGVNGYVFQSNVVESLTEKINLLAQSKEKITELGNYSFRIISEWSFENICLAIEKILSKNIN